MSEQCTHDCATCAMSGACEEEQMQPQEGCTHDCETCSANCSGNSAPQVLPPHAESSVKKIIGVVSGKGGVGKSLVTSLLAVEAARRGKRVGILDADITGPSIPKAFGIHEQATGSEFGIFPAQTKGGIQLMSTNLILPSEEDPVLWRGPILSGLVQQFWTDVIWDDIDVLFVDMPPGTGDVPMTVYQSLPIDGIVVVTSPQDLVSMIVAKAVKMAEAMKIPILGLIENMSYIECPDCGKRLYPFGESHIARVAEGYGLKVLGHLPIDPALAKACDEGTVEDLPGEWLKDAADVVLE